MRVIHVVTAWPRGPEDIITPWLVELLRVQRRRGLRPEVLAPAYRGGPRTPEAVELPAGVPVHRFRYAPASWETLTHDQTAPDRLAERPAYRLLVPAYLAGGSLRAWRLGRTAPQVAHVHWPLPHALLGAALRRGAGGRTALVSSFYSVELRWAERRLPWLRPVIRWAIRSSDAVTAISSATAEAVRGVAEAEVRVVPFAGAGGGEGAEARAAGSPAPGRREPLSGDGPLELLFVGRLVERKGVEVLVRALALVLRERPARLTVVGEGRWEGRIRAAARAAEVEGNVRMVGHVSRRRLEALYAACDVFVLPAVVDRKGDTEGLGVVLLEALRHARPVVASDVGGIPDIVRHGESGWLVAPGRPEALARALLEVAADPERARRVGQAGRRWAEERFSWHRVAGELEAVYREAIDRRRAAG